MSLKPSAHRALRGTRATRRVARTTPWTLATILVLAACGGDGDTTPVVTDTAATAATTDPCSQASGSITVYSGRSEELVADLYTQFTTATGIDVDVRYADSGELAGQILTEGSSSPADVFFSQDAGALGAVSAADLFTTLATSTLERVPVEYRAADATWIGASGRVRVFVYNPTLVETPPTTIDELLDPSWKGRIGFAPTNASWQSFVTALRVIRGEDGARQWLESFAANDPVPYEKNSAVRDAVDDGLVALGLVNHYYIFEKIAAEGADAVIAKNQFLAPGDVGGLVNVAGAGVIANTDNPQAAQCFVAYLVSDPAQKYFVERSFEYPLVEGIPAYEGLPSFASLEPPAIDLSDLSSLAATQELLADVGLLTL